MGKTIHIVGAGGPAGVGLTRCLKDHYTVTGSDSSQWAELMMECPKRTNSDPIDMTIAVPDSRWEMNDFGPPMTMVRICQNKGKTADVLGDLSPKTYWLRDTHGAGGSGAQIVSSFLPGKNYSVEFVIKHGVILCRFQKERISYSVKSQSQGIENRGSSAVSVVTDRNDVLKAATDAIYKIRDHLIANDGRYVPGQKPSWHSEYDPNGFFGVDLKCDEYDTPKVTEINAGRLLTASYAFFLETGYNLPLVGARSFFGEERPEAPEYPLGVGQIRQVGQLPQFFGPEVTKNW